MVVLFFTNPERDYNRKLYSKLVSSWERRKIKKCNEDTFFLVLLSCLRLVHLEKNRPNHFC